MMVLIVAGANSSVLTALLSITVGGGKGVGGGGGSASDSVVVIVVVRVVLTDSAAAVDGEVLAEADLDSSVEYLTATAAAAPMTITTIPAGTAQRRHA
ncbi:hypothetical protein [Mycobacteroides abscessus]|uniref:hypothetical protein n=1 Tax=Mycobacteroides abscessus TaxID=36809 RepID=UPI00188F2206|nr:hypothetical protein [Mycobacteroides abscessus]